MRRIVAIVALAVGLTAAAVTGPTPAGAHFPGQQTKDICDWIEAIRFGPESNGIVWSNCAEVHWWGEHQVVVRYTSWTSGNYYCVVYDRRGYDPDGSAFGWNNGCPGVDGFYGG